MSEALFRAVCLGFAIAILGLLPWPAIAGIAVLVLVGALLSNRTRSHRIAGSSVLITGASSGLGKALALDAARRGAKTVFLLARSREKLEQTAAEVRAAHAGCTPVVHPCDITDPDACRAVVSAIVEEHGTPDILVNNAGAGAWLHIEEAGPSQALAHMACPYLGAATLTHLLAPRMAERGSGHVLNVTSAASVVGFRGAVTYGTARWAMRGFSQYLRADLAEQGIGVSLLNAAEITGTSYFDNAPGKAGSSSHDRIPWLFHLPIVTAFSGDTHAVARSALSGVERGTHEILFPAILMVPTKLIADLFPELLHASLRLGPNGRR